MENTMLIGNGFDLYHYFFTSYKDYLDVCQYIADQKMYEKKELSVYALLDQVFHNSNTQKERLSKYEQYYKLTRIVSEELSELFDIVHENCWLKYLLEQKKDPNWTSLEKTVTDVLRIIESKDSKQLSPYFGDICPNSKRSSFLNEIKRNTKNLLEDFDKLIRSLKLYLKIFVDNVLEHIPPFNEKVNELFRNKEHIISFNYTHTYEKLYNPEAKVCYIHGSVDGDIIVGINPNKDDIKGKTNPKYIGFKKYYQRIMKKTILFMGELYFIKKNKKQSETLICVGHSLDVTDSDIIISVFDLFDHIIIYYHNDMCLDSYIKNLTQIYGAKEFNNMLLSLKIVFAKLPENNCF